MYGEKIKNQDFEIGYGAGCSYNNGRYSFSSGGGSDEYMVNITSIGKAYKEEDYIYIEDKYIALKERGDKSALYATSNSESELEILDQSKINYEEKDNNTIKNKYYDRMTAYKHTFKKHTDGSYYWYSTEPID